MIDEEHTIVAGLLQKPSRFFELQSLNPTLFEGKETKALFKVILRYRDKNGVDVDIPLCKTILTRPDSDLANELHSLVSEYEDYEPISDSEFTDSIQRVVRARQQELVKRKSVKALENLIEGDWDGSLEKMRTAIEIAENDFLSDDRPTNIRSASEIQVEKDQLNKERKTQIGGFDIGFKKITSRVSLRKRELSIIGGYTADGKTQLSKTFAYNANVNSNANVLYIALEMDRREMMALFISQHAARLDSRGIYYRDILDGTADYETKKLYLKALDDFEIDDHEDGRDFKSESGNLHVWAPLQEITIKNLTDRVKSLKSDGDLDIVFVDYLELVQPTKELGQYRLNVKYMCERSKSLAREEDVWMVLNHQISRSGRDAAEKRSPKHYLLRDLGESAGVERAADHVFWIYSDEDFKSQKEAKVGIAKARKGDTLRYGFHIMADYHKSLLGELDDL